MRLVKNLGDQLGKALKRAIPRAVFGLLLLVAFLMLAFYWRPRRFYSEHLMVLVHNHSATYNLFGSEHVLSSLLPATRMVWLTPVFLLNLGCSVWRSVDIYYWQPCAIEFAKVLLWVLLYFSMASMVLEFTGLATALSLWPALARVSQIRCRTQVCIAQASPAHSPQSCCAPAVQRRRPALATAIPRP